MAKSLDAILRIANPAKFLDALAEWVWDVPGRPSVPLGEIPETGRMIVVLNEIHGAINSSGLTYVLDWSVVELRSWGDE